MDILKELKESDLSVYDILEHAEYEDEKESDFFKTFGATDLVVETGGGEGEGEYVERVVFFKDHNFYAQRMGHYSSYEGTDWDEYEWTKVTPKEKTITVYN